MTPSPEERRAARAAARAAITPRPGQLRGALDDAYADGYAAGGLAAATEIPGAALVANIAGVYADAENGWSDWAPGDVAAGDLLADGGFARLLDQAGIAVDGLTGTTLDAIGDTLAMGADAGDSVDAIARSILDVVADPGRAYRIANTELARAVSAASLDTYKANGVEMWEWLISPGACDLCIELADGGPYGVDDEEPPPAHPSCRCSAAPVDAASEDQSAATDTVEEEPDAGAEADAAASEPR